MNNPHTRRCVNQMLNVAIGTKPSGRPAHPHQCSITIVVLQIIVVVLFIVLLLLKTYYKGVMCSVFSMKVSEHIPVELTFLPLYVGILKMDRL